MRAIKRCAYSDSRLGEWSEHVETNSRVVVGRLCGHEHSADRLRDELPRVQKLQFVESDRKIAKQMPRHAERSSELPPPLRQVAGISAPRLTPHAELIQERDTDVRQERDRDNNPAKERGPSAAVYRAAQSVALICTLCFCAAPVFAADLLAPAIVPSPAYLPAPYNWTGFYVGGNIGAGWSGLSDTNANFSDTLGSSFSAGTNAQFLAGGQVGVNYEFANGIVIGAETMLDWASNSQNAIVTATDPTGTVAANIGPSNARWLTAVSGRLGYAWDRVLLYAKGGGAWVATNTPAISIAGTPTSFTIISNTTSAGYTAGLGVEWAFSGNWSARGEYAYIGLPSQTFTVAPATPTFGGDVITYGNRNISIVTGAVNYKFGGWW
jgi:outer membrane immunogenic protein